MIHESIEKLIPHVSEDFITYPLLEEGLYIPFVNFWQVADSDTKFQKLKDQIVKFNLEIGYTIELKKGVKNQVIHKCFVYPTFKYKKSGGYEFIKEKWSIEEMIQLVENFIKVYRSSVK